MATPTLIRVDPNVQTEFAVTKLSSDSATKVSELLQQNHDHNDIIFTDFGLHNHIVHHLLTAFALGANGDTLQKHYDVNASYQRPPRALNSQVTESFDDDETFLANFNNTEQYNNYLQFFTRKIEASSVQDVVNKYVFAGDKKSDVMFNRIFAGYLHPIIHLGFGIEFDQPAIVAEALGQTAIHPIWLDGFFIEADKAAKANPQETGKPLAEILDLIHEDRKLSTAAHWDDDNKVRDGIMARAGDEMIKYAAMWRVKPEEIEKATAEMTNAAIYFTGAAQHPPKEVRFDFYYMHAVNSSIFFSSLIKQPWIDTRNKVKLIEWKGRLDLTLYASRRSPKLLLNEITDYKSKKPAQNWQDVYDRVKVFEDDGHASKLVRAIAHGQSICEPYKDDVNFRIKGDMWLNLGNMVIDSVENAGDKELWIRSAGFEEAWKDYPDRTG